MPKPYPDPSFNTTTGMIDHVNSLTQGWGTVMVCIAIPVVIFLLLKRKGTETSDSLLISMFFGFFFSTFFWGAGLLAGKIVVIFLLLTLGSALYSIFDKR